jgi:hypothetical protein
MPVKITGEPSGIAVELALAIEDPAGIDELRLAQALLAFGRAIPPHKRLEAAEDLQAKALLLK